MFTREIALMIQLGRVLGGVGWVAHIPITYIQLAGAGSINFCSKLNIGKVPMFGKRII